MPEEKACHTEPVPSAVSTAPMIPSSQQSGYNNGWRLPPNPRQQSMHDSGQPVRRSASSTVSGYPTG